MSNASNLLNGLELLYPKNDTIAQMKRTLNKYPECEDALVDAFSIGQIKSKLWLIENLPVDLGMVFICAGWYGTLASLMFEKARFKFEKIRSFDVDPMCAPVADTMNRSWVMDGWQFKASTLDIHEMSYPTTHVTYRADGSSLTLSEVPDTIINTSCEHIDNFGEWYDKIPAGTVVVLQSNDYSSLPEHINCSETLEDFDDLAPMQHTYYIGELELPKYTRFMKIGIK